MAKKAPKGMTSMTADTENPLVRGKKKAAAKGKFPAFLKKKKK